MGLCSDICGLFLVLFGMLFYLTCNILIFTGVAGYSADLHNYIHDFRYHVETTCEVTKVKDMGLREGSNFATQFTYRCWDVEVVQRVGNQTSSAQLFKSVQEAKDFECFKDCPNNCAEYVTLVNSSDSLPCFYKPGRPQYAYLESGPARFTYVFIGVLAFIPINFIVCGLLLACAHRKLPSSDEERDLVIALLFAPCILWVVYVVGAVAILLGSLLLLGYLFREMCAYCKRACGRCLASEGRERAGNPTGNQANHVFEQNQNEANDARGQMVSANQKAAVAKTRVKGLGVYLAVFRCLFRAEVRKLQVCALCCNCCEKEEKDVEAVQIQTAQTLVPSEVGVKQQGGSQGLESEERDVDN